MDRWLEQNDLRQQARLAAAELREAGIPTDRSVVLHMPEHITQDWIDEVVLRAHLVAPVWSDYALVEIRPTIWQLAAAVTLSVEDQFVLIADDSLVIASDTAAQLLVSISVVPVGDRVRYQISLHCLTMNVESLISCLTLHEIADRFGLVDFADAALIDEVGLRKNGQGAEAYIDSVSRRRPVFLFPLLSRLPTRAKQYHQMAHRIHACIGPVIVNDPLYRRYANVLSDRKFGCVAILPGGEVLAVQRSETGEPRDLYLMLERCPQLHEVVGSSKTAALGPNALQAWLAHKQTLPSVSDLTDAGEELREHWGDMLTMFALRAELDSPPSTPAEPQPVEFVEPKAKPKPRKIKVDSDGYPLSPSDLIEWAERQFSQSIVFLPRAAKAMSKVRHPEPARIARALEALAGSKMGSLRGQRQCVDEFDQALLELHMRDGFSNADRLKGQTGAAYIVEHDGRRMLLERHLCSLSSGFNDPKMIRIYYVFDRVADRIVIGWLPTHLPTSQS